MDSGKILLGVLAGVAVGATLGILFAPDKGSVTRRKIAEKGNDYAAGMEEKFNEFISTVTKQFEAMKDEAGRTAEKMGNEAEEARTDNTAV